MNILMTKDGKVKLETELNHLIKVRRPAISQAIGIAREHGDIKENAEYHAAKEEQSRSEARVSQITDILSKTVVVDISKINTTHVSFGATVNIVNEDTDEEHTYKILSEYESDLAGGIISMASPLGRALIQKEVGETATVNAPNGDKYYEILDIRYE